MPRRWSSFRLHAFKVVVTGKEHVALTFGQPQGQESVDEELTSAEVQLRQLIG